MNKGFWKKLAAAAVTAAMLVSLAACSSAKKDAGADGSEDVKTFIDVLEDGSIVCYLDKTEKGTGGGSSITIEEGEYLVIDSEITDGSVHVKVTHGGDDINEAPVDNDTPATIDYVFEESGKTKTTSKPLRGSLNSFRRCLAGVFLCLPIFRVFRAFNGSALSLLELACILFNTADVIHFGITHLAQL